MNLKEIFKKLFSKEYWDSFDYNIRSKVSNPFISTFFITFLLYNWDAMLYLLYNEDSITIAKRINEIKKIGFCIWIPFVIALISSVILNFSKVFSNVLTQLTDVKILPLFRKWFGESEFIHKDKYLKMDELVNSIRNEFDKIINEKYELSSAFETAQLENKKLQSKSAEIYGTQINRIGTVQFITSKGAPQNSANFQIPIDQNSVFKQIRFEYKHKPKYFRLGIKLKSSNKQLFNGNSILDEDSFLFHIFTNSDSQNLEFYCRYQPLNIDIKSILLIKNEEHKFTISVDRYNRKSLRIVLGSSVLFDKEIDYSLFESVYLLYWRDNEEPDSIEIDNLEIQTLRL